MGKKPFDFIAFSSGRNADKPRTSGLSLMTDWGLGLSRIKDLIEISGQYLDIAKIAAGTSRLYDEDLLVRKLALYKENQVRTYLGGQFQEYVFAYYGEAMLRRFLGEAQRLGFTAAEISDNYVSLTPAERREQIRMVRDFGMSPFGEVGSKEEKNDVDDLIRQIDDVLEAGAELALVEGAEFIVEGRLREDMFHTFRSRVDPAKIMVELPTIRVGSSMDKIHDAKKILVREFGPNVNIANLSPDEIMETEALRCGLGSVGPKPEDIAARRGNPAA